MSRRVTLVLIAGLCALFAGCGEKGEPQQDAALQDPRGANPIRRGLYPTGACVDVPSIPSFQHLPQRLGVAQGWRDGDFSNHASALPVPLGERMGCFLGASGELGAFNQGPTVSEGIPD